MIFFGNQLTISNLKEKKNPSIFSFTNWYISSLALLFKKIDIVYWPRPLSVSMLSLVYIFMHVFKTLFMLMIICQIYQPNVFKQSSIYQSRDSVMSDSASEAMDVVNHIYRKLNSQHLKSNNDYKKEAIDKLITKGLLFIYTTILK